MRETEIMKVLAEEMEQEHAYPSPLHHDKVFIIMWQSSKTGGTYTELRKSERGKDRFLRGLSFYGVDLREVQVFEQQKTWIPERKTKPKTERKETGATWQERNHRSRTKKMH